MTATQPPDRASDPGSGDPDSPPERFDEYRLIGHLGSGGMGTVHLARDRVLRRDVAIKFIRQPDRARRERFLIEARAAARLQHPNIASIYRVGQIDDQPYIVSEYVPGRSLALEPRPMARPRVLELGLAIARGLAAAHRRGVLHRDIKPGNIIVAEGAEPKLVDFGLAKILDPEPASGDGESPADEHRDHQILGTPYYMAPEMWRGEASTPRTDVYSLGVVLYELCAGHVPHHGIPPGRLKKVMSKSDAPALATVVPVVDPLLAAIIDRCLARDPDRRYASASAVRAALEALAAPQRELELPGGNPYRGLLAFEAEHRRLFFGRDPDVREVVERMRTQPVVLVAGDSGVGKSSLIRAGVLPMIGDHGLDAEREWRSLTLVPGLHPLSALVAGFAPRLAVAESVLASELADDVMALGRRLGEVHRGGMGPGTVVFIDQLEELITLSEPDQAAVACEVLACLAERTPGVRIVATVRGDKVTSLGRLPGLGRLAERSLYILHPLDEGEIRETIVGPARENGVRYETRAMIDTLVESALNAESGLPLLQFALARLWDARDGDKQLIPESALDKIGGVNGALSRHADDVLRGLLRVDHRDAAREIMLQLVSHRGRRARLGEIELVAGDRARRAALDALIEGRLVVAQETEGQPVYQIAHEALVSAWGTLRRWLDEEGGLRAVKERLATAAEEWKRLGSARGALWRGQQLAEADAVDGGGLSALEAAFLAASRRAERRARWSRRAVLLAPLLVIAAIYSGLRYQEAREEAAQVQRIAREVDGLLRDATPSLVAAREKNRAFAAARDSAFDAFARNDHQAGDRAWNQAISLAPEVDGAYSRASRPLEFAVRLDPGREDARQMLVAALRERARLADVMGRGALRDTMLEWLAVQAGEDELAPETTRVSLRTSPGQPSARLYRYRPDDGALVLDEVSRARETGHQWDLPPGSYLLDLPSSGETAAVRFPFLVPSSADRERGTIELHIDLPLAAEVPPGFVHVAPGAFLFGFGRDRTAEPVRQWYETLPLHQRRTGAFLIARHETTYGQWIEFLQSLPGDQRAARAPRESDAGPGDTYVALAEHDGIFELRFAIGGHEYRAAAGQPIIYRQRTRRARQDWLKFPVTGISASDARAYTGWLAATGRVPGARLCREDEWERAARGADDRMFSHGDRLVPDDANYDETYGREARAFGLDEVGSHPASRSPFGVDDMIGNAREMTESILTGDGTVALRGGSYFWGASTNVIPNREPMMAEQRLPQVGLRVCADGPRPEPGSQK